MGGCQLKAGEMGVQGAARRHAPAAARAPHSPRSHLHTPLAPHRSWSRRWAAGRRPPASCAPLPRPAHSASGSFCSSGARVCVCLLGSAGCGQRCDKAGQQGGMDAHCAASLCPLPRSQDVAGQGDAQPASQHLQAAGIHCLRRPGRGAAAAGGAVAGRVAAHGSAVWPRRRQQRGSGSGSACPRLTCVQFDSCVSLLNVLESPLQQT